MLLKLDECVAAAVAACVSLDISVNVIVRSIIFIIIKPGDFRESFVLYVRVNMRNSHSSKKSRGRMEKDEILFHKFP